MPLRLPPLSALRFFEAAGRHQSFKRAAEELNVTPSAVSHGVVALERALGAALFLRETRKLSLTPQGADYLTYVSEAFSLIAIGTQRLPSRHVDRVIAVSCAPTLAARWLLPRLGGFNARWPNVSVTVDTSRRQMAFPVDGFDFAVRLARAPTSARTWTRLFGERLAPVCAPGYLAGATDDQGRPDLRRATLIHVDTVGDDWRAWCEATGIEGLDLKRGLRVDTIQLALEAAAAGLGVALGRRPLADADIVRGVLAETGHPAAASSTAYWLVCADGVADRYDLSAFKRWLIEQACDFGGDAAADA